MLMQFCYHDANFSSSSSKSFYVFGDYMLAFRKDSFLRYSILCDVIITELGDTYDDVT